MADYVLILTWKGQFLLYRILDVNTPLAYLDMKLFTFYFISSWELWFFPHIFLAHFTRVFHSRWIKYMHKAPHITIFNQAREFHGDNYVFEVEQEKHLWFADKFNPQNKALDIIEMYSIIKKKVIVYFFLSDSLGKEKRKAFNTSFDSSNLEEFKSLCTSYNKQYRLCKD